MKIHHVGYLCPKLKKAEETFLMMGYEIEVPAKFDSLRNITISFLKNGDYRVELVEPAGKESPMYPLLKRYKNTPYHFCYEVSDLEKQIAKMEQEGYFVMQSPLEAPCINDRRVAFLMGRYSGIVELVEE